MTEGSRTGSARTVPHRVPHPGVPDCHTSDGVAVPIQAAARARQERQLRGLAPAGGCKCGGAGGRRAGRGGRESSQGHSTAQLLPVAGEQAGRITCQQEPSLYCLLRLAGSPLPKAGLASHTMRVVSALPVTTTEPSARQQWCGGAVKAWGSSQGRARHALPAAPHHTCHASCQTPL